MKCFLTSLVSGVFLLLQLALDAAQLSRVLRSQEWAVFATPEDKIYFVNQSNQSTLVVGICVPLQISLFNVQHPLGVYHRYRSQSLLEHQGHELPVRSHRPAHWLTLSSMKMEVSETNISYSYALSYDTPGDQKGWAISRCYPKMRCHDNQYYHFKNSPNFAIPPESTAFTNVS